MNRASVAAAVVLLTATGCGRNGSSDDEAREPPQSTRSSPASSAPSGDAAPGTQVVLYVSNQSFDDERVRLRVTLDGQVVADQYFDVEGQHNWVRFPVRVPIGRPLELAVEADSGASLRRSLVALEDVARGVVVDYWGAGEEAFVGATVVREPVAFA